MPDPIPSDDLYARLGVSPEADTRAIDRAWRALLKQHHPDIAGSMSLQLAKLINVAHDWLSHPERRARYDAAIRQREGRRFSAGRAARAGRSPSGRSAGASDRRPPEAPTRRPRAPRTQPPAPPDDDLDEVFGASAPAVRSFLAQAAALTADDIDRLSVSEPAASIAELRTLVPPELWARVDALDARLAAVLPPAIRSNRRASASARAYGRALVLELFLWFYLADAEPLLEQLRRGWESSVGLPRYGPNTDEVRALIARLARATPAELRRLGAAWESIGLQHPWPDDAHEFDFAALEVSTALARHDAATAVRAVPESRAEIGRLREAASLMAHVVTLRPIFSRRAFAIFRPAWDIVGGPIGEPDRVAARPVVRRA